MWMIRSIHFLWLANSSRYSSTITSSTGTGGRSRPARRISS
ncbi:Uncharacterised protein [Mycobacterium tuberculosis]|nr:Uncharacterised protein [Mycobacterium tuberculosis]